MACGIPLCGTTRNPKADMPLKRSSGQLISLSDHSQSNLQRRCAQCWVPAHRSRLFNPPILSIHSAHDAAMQFTEAVSTMAASAISLFNPTSVSFHATCFLSAELVAADHPATPYIYPATPPLPVSYGSGNGPIC